MEQKEDITIPERFFCKHKDSDNIQEIVCNPFLGGYIVAGMVSQKYQKAELQKLVKEGTLIIIDSENEYILD